MKLFCRLTLVLAIVGGVGLLGCAKTTDGDGDGDGGGHGLGWALDIAKPVADAELPGGKLIGILNDNITDSGEIGQQGVWVFFYAILDARAAEEFIAVYVFYDGSTLVYDEDDLEYDPEDWGFMLEIPGYRNAKPWVTAAEEALADYELEWAQRVLYVFSNDFDDYPGTDNIAFFMYIDKSQQPVALVWLDADTSELLEVSIF